MLKTNGSVPKGGEGAHNNWPSNAGKKQKLKNKNVS